MSSEYLSNCKYEEEMKKLFADLEMKSDYHQILMQLNMNLIFALVGSGSKELQKHKKNFSDVYFMTMKDYKFRNAVKMARNKLGLIKEYSAEEIYEYEMSKGKNILNYCLNNKRLLFREICAVRFPEVDIDSLDENNVDDGKFINNVDAIENEALGIIIDARKLKYDWDNCLQYYVLQPNLAEEIKSLEKDKRDFMIRLITPDSFMIGVPEVKKVDSESVVVDFVKGTKRYQFNNVYDVIKPFIKVSSKNFAKKERQYLIEKLGDDYVRVKIFRGIKRKEFDELYNIIKPCIKGNLHISEDTEKDIISAEHKSGKSYNKIRDEYYKGAAIAKDTIRHKIKDSRI